MQLNSELTALDPYYAVLNNNLAHPNIKTALNEIGGKTVVLMVLVGKSERGLTIDAVSQIEPENISSAAETAKSFNLPSDEYDYQNFPKLRMQKVLGFIEENIEETILLASLAALARMSVCYFVRRFKQTTGKSPYQFVLERKIDHAKSLLTTTDLPLVEIALRCGCSSQSHFTTVFKQFTAQTPKRYRDQHQSSDGAIFENTGGFRRLAAI